MPVVSKFFGEELTSNSKSMSLLSLLCTLSSSTSAIILFKLYRKSIKIRKSTKKALELQSQTKQNSEDKTTKTKTNLNKKFIAQFKQILAILIPKWRSAEIGYMTLISSLLVVRSLCEFWTIYLGTRLESAIISGELASFITHLKKFAMTMPLMSLTSSLLKYSTRSLEIRFRSRLTKHVMQKYMYKLTFYQLNQKMRNVDQLITNDLDMFAKTCSTLYSQLSKPLMDILIYVYGISRYAFCMRQKSFCFTITYQTSV